MESRVKSAGGLLSTCCQMKIDESVALHSGQCHVFIERLWRTIKYELVYLHSFRTVTEAKYALQWYIEFYNSSRPHQALNYKTPNDMYYAKEIAKCRIFNNQGQMVDSQKQPTFWS